MSLSYGSIVTVDESALCLYSPKTLHIVAMLLLLGLSVS